MIYVFGKLAIISKNLTKWLKIPLHKIEVWCNRNGMTISDTKYTAILFTEKQKNKKIILTFNVLSIETSKQIKYMGVNFQENRLFNAHIKSVQVKFLKRLNVLRYLKASK